MTFRSPALQGFVYRVCLFNMVAEPVAQKADRPVAAEPVAGLPLQLEPSPSHKRRTGKNWELGAPQFPVTVAGTGGCPNVSPFVPKAFRFWHSGCMETSCLAQSASGHHHLQWCGIMTVWRYKQLTKRRKLCSSQRATFLGKLSPQRTRAGSKNRCKRVRGSKWLAAHMFRNTNL